MVFKHYPVMLHETVDGLGVVPDGIYVDCTLGGCGHTKEILSRLGENGRVIGIDLDTDALNNARNIINDPRLILWHGNYKNIKEAVYEIGINTVNGVLFDLGVSSFQIDTAERGFSYMHDAPLDMRMNREEGITAEEIVNTFDEEEIAKILFEYGEERYSRKIASKIVEVRKKKPIHTTFELNEIIESACPQSYKRDGNVSRRSFQALRIKTNEELEGLDNAFRDAVDLLVSGGRIAVISFHSLEDRIVKNTFQTLENPCTCPKDFPICVCGKKPVIKIITKKPIVCSEQESKENSRSHSAKLRIAEKI